MNVYRKIGFELEMDIVDDLFQPIQGVRFPLYDGLKEFFTSSDFKIDEAWFEEDQSVLPELSEKYKQWKQGDDSQYPVELSAEYAVKALAYLVQKKIPNYEHLVPWLDEIEEGFSEFIGLTDPEATKNMIEIDSGVHIDPYVIHGRMGILITIINTILALLKQATGQSMFLFHGSPTLLIDTDIKMEGQITEVPYSKKYSEYVYDRVQTIQDFVQTINPHKHSFWGVAFKGFQVNFDTSELVSRELQEKRDQVDDFDQREQLNLLLRQNYDVFQEMDKMCYFKTLFAPAAIVLFGASPLKSAESNFPYLDWMQTGKFADDQKAPIRFEISSRTAAFPNLLPESDLQDGSPDTYFQKRAELVASGVMAPGKMYMPFFPKSVTDQDVAIVEDRIYDIPPSFYLCEHLVTYACCLHLLSLKYGNLVDFEHMSAKRFQNDRMLLNNSMIDVARNGKSDLSYTFPKAFIKLPHVQDILNTCELTANAQGKLVGSTDQLVAFSLALMEHELHDHPLFGQKLHRMKEWIDTHGSFAEYQWKQIGDRTKESIAKFYTEHQTFQWNHQSYHTTLHKIQSHPHLGDIYAKYCRDITTGDSGQVTSKQGAADATQQLETFLALQVMLLLDK